MSQKGSVDIDLGIRIMKKVCLDQAKFRIAGITATMIKLLHQQDSGADKNSSVASRESWSMTVIGSNTTSHSQNSVINTMFS